MKTPSNIIFPAKVWKYSAGEIGLRIQSIDNKIVPEFIINSSDDFMAMLLYLNARNKAGKPVKTISMPYMPYSRQDRVVETGDPIPMEIIAGALQQQGIKTVCTVDIHSSVAADIFIKYDIVLKSEYKFDNYAEQFYNLEGNCVAVYSDKGCADRVDEFRRITGAKYYLKMDKARDTTTGKIVSMFINDWSFDLDSDRHYDFIVVDDICDGGRTFIEVAKIIREKYPKSSLHLYVSHGIFSNGLEELEKYYSSINCGNKLIPQK
jgi:ribose-phosphate pyrophosphokinase